MKFQMKLKRLAILILMCLGLCVSVNAAPPKKPSPHIKGIHEEAYLRANANQKREVLKIMSNYTLKIEKVKYDFRNKREKIKLEKDLLEVDIDEARALRDDTRIKTLLEQFNKKELVMLDLREQEHSMVSKLEEERLQAVIKVLAY
ncbi:hypothetical protein LS70_009540 [Helicobacter sp. MIT 11-5569]|uniref:hypothetical protein n=1 Tax=Helicobacter sp. MIT 11-5569 TaxID=1548151 RepID=UPI00051FE322|nr:hypothetical protein [Helicobacter sp. MIT 11-5569]TLD79870.1 hypothetical protein LS70_009540 [Helicobacter sp. MIT 11-5569]